MVFWKYTELDYRKKVYHIKLSLYDKILHSLFSIDFSLEDDYMMDQKPNDRFDFSELCDTPQKLLVGSSNSMNDVVVGGLLGYLTDSRS